MADVILLVAQLELSSLRNVVRMMQTLGTDDAAGGQGARWCSTASAARRDISLKKAEETIGKPVYWQLPNDAKLMMESRNQGVPLVLHAPKSKLQQSFAGLAQALCGKETAGAGQGEDGPVGAVRAAITSRRARGVSPLI